VVPDTFGRWRLFFDPEAAPLAPDFRFRFEEDHEGSISVIVEGDYRYEGFLLHGQLTRPGTKPVRDDWPREDWPPVWVSAEPDFLKWMIKKPVGMTLPATRHAKRLRDVFINDYGAKDWSNRLR
jgi:hypothetical protein